MYPNTYEFTDCQFCGEKIEAFHRRCPYCAGIQKKKKNIQQETTEYKPGFQRENTSGSAGQGASATEGPVPTADSIPEKEPEPDKKPMGNGKKVLLTVLVTLIPVLGQFFGIVISAVYMSSSEDDKSSFGSALFKASVILSILEFLTAFFIIIALLT